MSAPQQNDVASPAEDQAHGEAAADPQAFYVRLEGPTQEDGDRVSRFRSTVHSQGAWRETEMHMAAVSGLLVHEIEQGFAKDGLRLARMSYDILGTLHSGELTARTRIVRPGRTIELVECALSSQGRTVIVGRAWLLATAETAEAVTVPDAPLTPRQDCHGQNALSSWAGGFIAALTGVTAPDHGPGHGRIWITNDLAMVDGEPTSDLVRLLGMVDTANGIAPVLDPTPGGWFFPNVDLQIHLHRAPQGQWLGLANQVSVGPDGVGLTTAVLHDEHGPFGRSEQTLTVRAWPRA